MKKILPILLALTIGIGAGFFVPRSPQPHSLGSDAHASSPENGTNLRTGSTSRTASPRKPKPGQSDSIPKSLAALMALTSTNYQETDTIEFLQAVEALDADQISTMISDLPTLDRSDMRRYRISHALFKRLATINPDAAWDALTQLEDKQLRNNLTATVIGIISKFDLSKASALLAEIKDPQSKQSALYGWMSEAAAQDPAQAFRLLATEPIRTQGSSLYQSLFHIWAKDDPEAALAKLSEIKKPQELQQALNGIASALVATDPQRALALLDQVPSGQKRQNLLSSITTSWMQEDSDAAFAWIKTLPIADQAKAMQSGSWQMFQSDPAKAATIITSLPLNNNTNHLISQLAQTWAQSDPAAAKSWVESLSPGKTQELAITGLIQTMSSTDPAQAASLFGDTVVNNQNSHLVGNLAGEWIKTDQAAALAWINSLDLRGNALQNVQSQLIGTLATEDPAAACRYALSISDAKSQEHAVNSLVQTWGNEDPQAAKDWIMSTLEGSSKVSSLNSLIQRLTYSDRETALRFYQEATTNLTPEAIENTYSSTAGQIASYWAQEDPKAAATWVMSLPEGQTRLNSFERMVDSWGDNDIKSAAAFLNTVDAGNDRDGGVKVLISDLHGQDDHESAFDWANTISNASQREDAIRDSAQRINNEDPAAARAAISRANLSANAKAEILKSIQN